MLERIVTAHGRVLIAAQSSDIADIVALEQRPDMSEYIYHWPTEQHRRNLADPNMRYLVLRRPEAGLEGFVILGDLLSPNKWVALERIALVHHGLGLGQDVLRAVIDAVFDSAGAHRLQLDVFVDNTRARRAYEVVGFREEGVLRDAVWRDDRYVSLVIMAMLAGDRAAVKA